MAVLGGSKRLVRIQGDDPRHRGVAVAAGWGRQCVGDTLDTLDLQPVVQAQCGGQRLVIAPAQGPSQPGVDVIVDIAQDYGWRLLAGGKPRLRGVQWPRLLEYLSGGLDGQPVFAPTSTWYQAKRSLLSRATARALVSALLRYHEACNDVWQDLWSQRCEGGRVPSRSILLLVWNGCGTAAPVWVQQCASTPLCGSCRECAGRGWPKARWALRHSGRLTPSTWKAIYRHLRDVQMDGVRCRNDQDRGASLATVLGCTQRRLPGPVALAS